MSLASAASRADAQPFSLEGPLPRGRVVLEASAGTGKTYTIAGLATRYVAEGVCTLPELLVVTFTRAAASELRDRVRSRLVAGQAHLDAVLAGVTPDTDDDALRALGQAEQQELVRRRGRLALALAEFDAATITTIHGFCQQVLNGLGLLADLEPGHTVEEDTSELLEEVVDDLYVARYADRDDPPLTRSQLLELAETVAANPDADLVPDPDQAEPAVRERVELVELVRERFVAHKRRRGVLSYDDLLTRLRDALVNPELGEAAVTSLRRRYRVALVDEFQDTDPVQWDVLREAFGGEDSSLVLIGDPKQAIYAFRGADVHAYLDAVRGAGQRATLSTSWRADADLLTGFDALFEGVAFGHRDIRYQRVTPAPAHREPRLRGPDVPAAVRLRCLRRDQGLRGSHGDIAADVARNHLVADVTAELVGLLESGLEVLDRDRDGQEAGERGLGCGDVAVLVRTNAEANLVQRSLLDAQVPAIINGVGSVLATPAATDWQHLLDALEQPTSSPRARTVALTPFLGWPADRLAASDDEDVADVHDLLHAWAGLLRDHGVASLLRTVTVTQRLPERVLRRPDGERYLTDLQHVGELLHTAATAEDLGPSALAGWLRARTVDAAKEAVPPDERARRLESDDDAVQILTIHRSKGLEFPVVLCPFLSTAGRDWVGVPVFHDPATGRRTVDVGGPDGWEGTEESREASRDEQRGELLRLLYVALTRARHHVVVWWAPVKSAKASGLGRVLFGRRDADGVLDSTATAPIGNDDRLQERLAELAARADGHLAVETVTIGSSEPRWQPPEGDLPPLEAARIDRDVDDRWQRTSYSRLTAQAAVVAELVGSEPDEPVTDDEAGAVAPEGPAAPTLSDQLLREVDLPLGDAAAGPVFGSLVHAVLEEVDFAADDLPGELERELARQGPRFPVQVAPDELVPGLAAAIATPLGPLADGRALRDFAPGDRLDEMRFELPLGGGDDAGRPGGRHRSPRVSAIGRLLTEHLPASDPLADYPDLLAEPGFDAPVHGFLNGSIDLVLRVCSKDSEPRYLVADHKTNRLAPSGTPLSAWDYRPEALADAMMHGHYPLQALLYQAALHRYLRWRQPGYDPAVHLGGVLYLFLRGMVGDAGRVEGSGSCGVFAWSPPAGLVVALSDLLDGGRP